MADRKTEAHTKVELWRENIGGTYRAQLEFVT